MDIKLPAALGVSHIGAEDQRQDQKKIFDTHKFTVVAVIIKLLFYFSKVRFLLLALFITARTADQSKNCLFDSNLSKLKHVLLKFVEQFERK